MLHKTVVRALRASLSMRFDKARLLKIGDLGGDLAPESIAVTSFLAYSICVAALSVIAFTPCAVAAAISASVAP